MLEFLYLIAIGGGVGFISGMFGIGGAVVLTPILILLGYPDTISLATPLVAAIPSSISATIVYSKEKLINFKQNSYIIFFAIIFGWLGVNISMLSPKIMIYIKAFFMILLAINMFVHNSEYQENKIKPSLYVLFITGALAGLISGAIAIGGGLVYIFAFKNIIKMNMKSAIANSLFCVGMAATFNASLHYIYGNVDLSLALPIVIGVIPMARYGAKLSLKLKNKLLQTIFGYILIIFALIFIIMKTFVLNH